MTFDAQQRALLAALADGLIPSGGGLPSASEAGVAGQWLDAVLVARPDLADDLLAIVEKARDRDAAEYLEELAQSDPQGFWLLTELVPNAYFMNPDVRKAIGYEGQGPQAIDPRPDYMEDGLLESVIRRGPIYRPTPGDGQTHE